MIFFSLLDSGWLQLTIPVALQQIKKESSLILPNWKWQEQKKIKIELNLSKGRVIKFSTLFSSKSSQQSNTLRREICHQRLGAYLDLYILS